MSSPPSLSLKSLSEEYIIQKTKTLEEAIALADKVGVSYDEEEDSETQIRQKIIVARGKLLKQSKVYLTSEELMTMDKNKVLELGKKYLSKRMEEGGLTVGAVRRELIEHGDISPVRGDAPTRPASPIIARPVPQRQEVGSDDITPKPLNCDDVFRSNDSCNNAKHTKEFIRDCAFSKGFTLSKDLSKKGMCEILVPPKKKTDILSQIDTKGFDEKQKKRLRYLNQFSVPQLKEIVTSVRQSSKHNKCYPEGILKDLKHELLKQMVSWEKEYVRAYPENGFPNFGAFDRMYSKPKRHIASWKSIMDGDAEPVEDEIDVAERASSPVPAPRRVSAQVIQPTVRRSPKVVPARPKYPEVTKDVEGKSQDPSPCSKTGRNVGTFIRAFEKQRKENPDKKLSDIFQEYAVQHFGYKQGQVALPSYLSNNVQGAARYLCEIHEDKKCDSAVDCEDGKSCEVDANRCISVHPDVPASNKKIINGRLFVGSERALAKLEETMVPPRQIAELSPSSSHVHQSCDNANWKPCPSGQACDIKDRKCRSPPSDAIVETIDGIKVFGSRAALDALINERDVSRQGLSVQHSPNREIDPLAKPKEGQQVVLIKRPVIQDLNIPNHAVADVRKRILQCLKIV